MRRSSGETVSPDEARSLALRYLARRDYATRELEQKLVQRGAKAAAAAQVVDALVAEGLMNDARFAENYCRLKVAGGQGAQRLRAGLRQRGVDEALVDQALAAYAGDWEDAALAFVGRRAGDLADEKERARLYRAGLRRGFSHEQVMRAIDRLRRERAV